MRQALVDGRYEISGPLGGGGMAKVYLARDRVLDRDVAIKVLREQYAEDEGFVERFRREARSAACLSHPNIVQVYDRGRSENGEYYIAMEYVPGGTLKDRLVVEGSIHPDEAAAVAERVADALSEAHEKGVIHRDIKPHNVLLTGSGGVKVADFGIARAASSSGVTATSVILGTAAYMSPEQAKGEPATPRSDLYSLGIVLYEMLTGKVPYEAQTPVAVAVKHISQPPRLPREENPEVPDGLNDIVAKLLAKRPENRYASAIEVVEDLRRARRGKAPVAQGAAYREVGAARENPTTVLRSGGASLAAGGARRRGRGIPLRVLAASVALVASLSVIAWAVSGERLAGRDATQAPAALLEEARHALGGKVEVPGVVGLQRAEAQARLVGVGFEVEIRPRQSLEANAGEVLRQSLPGGQRAEEGAKISLDVGDGPRAVPAPDLIGLTLDQARGVLDEAGLSLGDVDEAPSNTVPEGAILEQDPPAGEELEPDAPVDLTLSSGPEQPPAPEPAPPATPPPSSPVLAQYSPETYYYAAPSPPTPQQYEPASTDEPFVPEAVVPDLSGLPFGGNDGDGRKGSED